MPLIVVGIYREYDYPDLLRQTPDNKGIWGDVCFTVDPVKNGCDVLVILNAATQGIEIECSEIWQVVQEPPVGLFPWIFESQKYFARIFSPYAKNGESCCQVQTHGALPWHLEKTYNELIMMQVPDKSMDLSWITSNKSIFPGHKKRMKFLRKLQESNVSFDLYGRGFNPVEDKSDALFPYKYSLAIENYVGPDYWTEKVADCFLSWTMPIYYGCTNLADYFPLNSFVQIDIADPEVVNKIDEIAKSDLYERNREAISEARDLVLNHYQLFPFIEKLLPKNFAKRRKWIVQPFRENIWSRFSRKLKWVGICND